MYRNYKDGVGPEWNHNTYLPPFPGRYGQGKKVRSRIKIVLFNYEWSQWQSVEKSCVS